jgi:hypothetical protein
MMRHVSLLLITMFSLTRASGQVLVYGAGDPASTAITHLSGANVTLMNAFSQTVDPQQVAVFSDSTMSIGLDSGLVISTGIAYGVMGPNNIPNMTFGGGFAAYDTDIMLMSLPNVSGMFDPGIIQMDLVPEGDTLEIRYVFGSEEYDEYVCTDKDDRFGLFLSGPGLAGPFSNGSINMATLPASGLPVTVNTLNRGINGTEGNTALCNINPGWLADTIYYINNDFGPGTQLDGYTVVLTARAVVVPGSSYHLKLAIADVNDANFDSAVFLPEGAISCNELSTGIDGSGSSTSCPWLNVIDQVIYIRGLSPDGGMIALEAFDTTGRLLQRSTARPYGTFCSMAVDPGISGTVIIRILQGDRVTTGRVWVR